MGNDGLIGGKASELCVRETGGGQIRHLSEMVPGTLSFPQRASFWSGHRYALTRASVARRAGEAGRLHVVVGANI